MIKHIPIPVFFILFFFFRVFSYSQDENKLMSEARQLEAAFKENEAMVKYLDVLKIQPRNYTALCKVSELYSLLGKRQPTKEKQKIYYRAARNYAQQALLVNPSHPDANFVMALAMGRMAIISSGEEKIKAVKDIKIYAEKCVQLDPQGFKGYHILGRWHYEISNLSAVEKWLVKIAYGSLPEASLQEAIANYEKSRQLNPGLLINYMELAKCFHRKDENKKANEMLQQVIQLPSKTIDDPTVKEEARKLMKKWNE
jgi:tetratricopeptide (TPR) repeat protein